MYIVQCSIRVFLNLNVNEMSLVKLKHSISLFDVLIQQEKFHSFSYWEIRQLCIRVQND